MLGSRDSSAIGLVLSVLLALSMWTGFGGTGTGLSGTQNLAIPTGPELTSHDLPEDGQPARFAGEVELKEDSKGQEEVPDQVDVMLGRGLLALVSSSSCPGWPVEVRSSVSKRIREGHGARGPPRA